MMKTVRKGTARAIGFGFTLASPLLVVTTVEIVSGDDRGTPFRIFICGTVVGVIAALDASTRTEWFDELNVVVVTQANAALGVSLPTDTSARIVLASCIVRVQSTKLLWANTPCDCKSKVGISHQGEMKQNRGKKSR